MKAEEVFKELMLADELQSLLGIPKGAVESEVYSGQSDDPRIDIIKDVIRGVENKKSNNAVYQTIIKKRPL